jgi:hypothetical protein
MMIYLGQFWKWYPSTTWIEWTEQGQAFWSYRQNKQNSRWLPGGYTEYVTKLIFERTLHMVTINQHTKVELNRPKHSELNARTSKIQDGCHMKNVTRPIFKRNLRMVRAVIKVCIYFWGFCNLKRYQHSIYMNCNKILIRFMSIWNSLKKWE